MSVRKHCILEYYILLMSYTVYVRAVMLVTIGLQEAFTLASANHVSVMDIQLNVTAPLATAWLVFICLKHVRDNLYSLTT